MGEGDGEGGDLGGLMADMTCSNDITTPFVPQVADKREVRKGCSGSSCSTPTTSVLKLFINIPGNIWQEKKICLKINKKNTTLSAF